MLGWGFGVDLGPPGKIKKLNTEWRRPGGGGSLKTESQPRAKNALLTGVMRKNSNKNGGNPLNINLDKKGKISKGCKGSQ